MRTRTKVLQAAAIVAVSGNVATAANFTWDGTAPAGVTANFWSNNSNWVGNVTPPNDGTADIFINSNIRLDPIVDVAWSIDTLSFANSANYSLSGQTLTINASLGTPGTGTTTINNTLALVDSFNFNAGGTLVINGALSDGGGVGNILFDADQLLVLDGTVANSIVRPFGISGGTIALSRAAGVAAITGNVFIGSGTGTPGTAILRIDATSRSITQAAET